MTLNRSDVLISLLGIFALALWLIPPLFPSDEEKELRKEAKQSLRCNDLEHCTKYWLRAKEWIRINSEHGVVWEMSNVIQTYDPVDSLKINRGNTLSFKVSKIIRSNTTIIDIEVDCNQFFGNCQPSPVAARAAFKRYVRD